MTEPLKQNADVIQRAFTIGAVVLLTVTIFVRHLDKGSASVQVVSDLAIIFATSFISYVITRYYALKTSREELRDLAEASGQRIFLLSSQITELADEILSFEPDGERSKIYYQSIVSQMNKLSSQAELSFQDMHRIAKIDVSIPALKDEARTRIAETTRREIVPCPHCKEDKELLLDVSRGSTRHTRCDKCDKTFVAHRTADGSIKLSYEDTFAIQCPNPSCVNTMNIKRNENEWGTTIRDCFECYARIRFDLEGHKIEGYDIEPPLNLPRENIVDGRADCPYCSFSLRMREGRNRRGEQIQFCRNCTKLVRIE